ncbi:hypothetical protein GCM10028784_35170 [Myceligenerans cantabricum]
MGRPGATDRVVFELDDDDGLAPPDGSGTDPEFEDGDGPVRFSLPSRPWWRRRRWWLVAAAVLALTGAGAVDEVRDHRDRAEHLVAAPGGVLSLAEPPSERWRVSGTADVWPSAELVVATMNGTVVGLDPQTGQVEEDFGAAVATRCGPVVGRPRLPVCLAKPSGGTDDGVDPAAVVEPGPDGTYLTASRIGPDPAESPVSSACDGGRCRWFGAITDARDVRVQATDAATGDVRWRRTVEFRTVSLAERCVDDDVLDIESVSMTTTAHTVLVEGCGIDSWLAANGQVMERARSVRGDVEVLPRPDGGYRALARQGALGTGLTLMFGPDGTGERDASGTVLDPVTTDGSAGSVNLVQRGAALLRVGEDGRILWDTERTPALFLARTAREGVLLDDSGVATGIDLGSGETLWTTQVGVPGDGAWSGYGPEVAFTDGRRVMVLVRGDSSGADGAGGLRAVTLDLRTGERRWAWDVPDGWEVRAVGGRLVAQTGDGLVGLD